ncbi:MAG: dimethylarginine dimethylaminohydrolase family protein [Pseudonocardiaceae bacterium]
MCEDIIDVRIPSDIAVLREVLVGLVKPFTLDDLIAEAQDEADPKRRTRPMSEVLARYSVEAPDAALATIQHERLVAVLAQHGVTLHWVEPTDVRIQLYTRDMGFGIDDVFFRARPATAVRRREQAGLAWLLPRLSKVCELADGHIEGGDVIVTDDDVLVGIGDSTNAEGVESLRKALAAEGIDRRVVPIEFAHPGVVHLDVHFTLAGPNFGLFNPKAFAPGSRAYFESRFDLVEVTEDETRSLAVNTVALAPDKLILHATDERIASEIESRGTTPVPIDYSEITRFPGGLHCSTLPLVRG